MHVGTAGGLQARPLPSALLADVYRRLLHQSPADSEPSEAPATILMCFHELEPACINTTAATQLQFACGMAKNTLAVMNRSSSSLPQGSQSWACLGKAMSAKLMGHAAHLMEGQYEAVAFCCHLPPDTHDLVMVAICWHAGRAQVCPHSNRATLLTS